MQHTLATTWQTNIKLCQILLHFRGFSFFPSFSLLQLKSLFLVLTYFIHSLNSMTESSLTCSMSFVLKCFVCVGLHVSYWPASLVRCSSLEACFRREINLLSGMASLTCSRSSTRAATPTATSPTLMAISRYAAHCHGGVTAFSVIPTWCLEILC